ncbi:MAG: permease, partial [Lentisphaerae bacterium]|nr:permease [Lentisphaerota bacterium]
YLIIGTAIGAFIYGYVPQDWVVSVAGKGNHFAIPLAALIGVPLYIRAESAIPIGLALAQKGMSLGAVIALVIGGAGMAIPEMSMLLSIFKGRVVAAIVALVFLTAVIGRYCFDGFLG